MTVHDRGQGSGLAPVIPLFGGEADPPDADDAAGEIERQSNDRNQAERNLTKKLSARSLSVREARAVVAEHDLGPEAIDDVIAGFVRRGYLDDAALAEQLVRAGTDRKGQGRQVLARTLAKRGIPRDVADAALASLPDDDAERALALARSRAGALRNVPADAALRRLAGQLSRRGYSGSVALGAAREALAEAALQR